MNIRRTESGMSLIEMLAAIFIMGFVSAAICEIAVTQNLVAFRTGNKMSTLVGLRRIAGAIEQDIRMASFVGDQYGDPTNSPTINANYGPNYFPSVPTDPFYDASYNGYPGTTTNTTWPPMPYVLSPQTLILQLPVFPTKNAPFPTKTTSNNFNVDTYVYQVLADSTHPSTGQFILQRTIFAGAAPSVQTIPSNQPTTLLTGIVGPINPSDAIDPVAGTPRPKVFGFFTGDNPLTLNGTAIDSPTASQALNVNGVSVTIEAYSSEYSKRTDFVPKTVAVHDEVYMRSNHYVSH